MSTLYRARRRARETVTKYGIDNPRLDVLHHLPKLRTWQRRHLTASVPQLPDRFGLYQHLQRTVIKDESVDYLEFGVYKGESLAYWTELNTHPDSTFWGFDSFEGLPEDWHYFGGVVSSSTFDTGGQPPEVPDARAGFVKGLFQDSVPGFLDEFEPRSRLVLHCDADLYSSTLFALTQCHRILVPGSIVVFDEFASVLDEFSALRDFCTAYRREYDVIGWTPSLAQVALMMR